MAAALPPPASFPSSIALVHASFKPQFSFIPRATPDSDSDSDSSSTEPDSSSKSSTSPDSDPFESRLSHVRLRYRSGTGKKAELRKSKKSGTVPGSTSTSSSSSSSTSTSSSSSSSSSSIYLPPVPLKEAISNGLKVDFGFTPYTERINGWIAILGVIALVLVELATDIIFGFIRCNNRNNNELVVSVEFSVQQCFYLAIQLPIVCQFCLMFHHFF
ncbi:hypothetical protein REPUB_Repub13aG0066600 [Reevesia pubescens]